MTNPLTLVARRAAEIIWPRYVNGWRRRTAEEVAALFERIAEESEASDGLV